MKSIFVFFFIAFCMQLLAQTPQGPNIIYIMSDDHDVIQTPNIDRLAKEGVRFTNSFVSNSICSPARATILTGKFSHLNGVKDNRNPFDTSQYTFIKQLKSSGYQTAIVGKWHLHITPSGFDYWKILQGQGFYYNPVFISGKDTISHPDKYATEVITEDALRWITNRDKQKPFVLMMHHKAPHREWFPTLRNLKKFSQMKFPEPSTLLFSDTSKMGTAFRKQKMGIYNDMRLTVDLKVDPAYIRDIPHLKPNEAEEKFYYSLMSRLPKEIRAEAEKIYAERGKILRERKPEKHELLKLKYQWYMQDYLACVASVDESVGKLLDYLEKNKLR
jgi:arylsulfatase A-like enzyme